MGGCPPSLWHTTVGFSGIPSQGKDLILSAGYHPGLGCFSHYKGCTLWDPESFALNEG